MACATALIANHRLLANALKTASNPPADAAIPAGYVEPERVDWEAAGEQLEKATDHAMHSISAMYIAVIENQSAVQPDFSRATAQHALACLEGVLAIHAPLHAAARKCAIMGGGGTWPSVWANLTFRIDEMREQAMGSIESVQISARQEAVQVAGQAEVYGAGEHEFEVMVTMQTTAHRFIHVRADDPEIARGTALRTALDEQGAHFLLNEGNHVASDNLHANAVYDSNGDEVWNNDTVFRDDGTGGDAPTM